MVSIAAFGCGHPGSNPSPFAVSNLNCKLDFTNNARVSHYCKPAMGDTLAGGDK